MTIGTPRRPSEDTDPEPAYYTLPAAEAAERLGVTAERGLSEAEAAERLARYGPNATSLLPTPAFWQLFLRQFQSLLILLLVVAAVISLVVGDPRDAIVILAVVLLNALIGSIQEARAERAMASLRELSAPHARVLRDGHEREILAEQVVPGDVAVVRAGDLVPADGRLLESVNLQVDESALTGESLPVDKDARLVLDPETSLPDRLNLLYSGTAVTLGHGRLLVTATGGETEVGRLARSVSEARPPKTPLERQIDWLGKVLSALALGASGLVFVLGLWRQEPLGEMFLVALSLAVAAVPEGLPAVVTVVLALGVQRLARRNAIVRRLASVEALGAATIICTDKTGTLTLGQMRVAVVVVGDRRLDVRDGRLWDRGRPLALGDVPGVPSLLTAAALCNNAQLGPNPSGDPTERALLHLLADLGFDRAAVAAQQPRTGEIPFSSERKLMTTVHRAGQTPRAYTKGAPDAVLARASSILTADGPQPLTDERRAAAQDELEALAERGLRVLALAERQVPPEAAAGSLLERADELERELTLIGLVGLLDPPRPEVPAALATADRAGIRTIMMTGDHPTTARAIAERLGISNGHLVNGADLERLATAELPRVAASASVYARVAPRQKLEIVQALQRSGAVVAMTGDGANDAPALRLADIGVAMGIRGTAVAREAAGIVLADDHYATIVAAVEEGRTIYANLRKAVIYLLSGNLGEILVILTAILVGLPLPLQPVQILWVNLVTDALPAIGLGMEPTERGIMSRPPRTPGEPFLPPRLTPLIVVPSILLAVASLAAFVLSLVRFPGDVELAQSAAFLTLVLAHLGIGWAQRATFGSTLGLSPWTNRTLLASFIVGAGSMLLLLYTGPGQTLFSTRPLDAIAWVAALALTPLPLLGAELTKALLRRSGVRQSA